MVSPVRQKGTTISGEFSLDAEGEFPTRLIVDGKRYLVIFSNEFYDPSTAMQNYENLSSSPLRSAMKGIVYNGKIICKNFAPSDGAIFVLNIGEPAIH
ncbi:MAG: hypothetical protein AABZ73_06015 [Pseudomonadota bacterium]|uniref:hypothetical protein n=1 Tax=Sphingobium sp. TaxID=1912891 RepID=UPI002E1BB9C5